MLSSDQFFPHYGAQERDPLLNQECRCDTYGTGEVRVQLKRAQSVVRRWVNLYGPGLIVMLAAADAGSLVTSAQIGKEWGYAMLLWQILLIYPLYITQELAVRLGAATGLGHAQLIRKRFGPLIAISAALVVLVTCMGTIAAEMTAIIGVSQVVGISPQILCFTVVSIFIIVVFTTGSAIIEQVCLTFGLCEIVFIFSMFFAEPKPSEMIEGFTHAASFGDSSFNFLLAASVGSVLSPWMVYYEQSAVVDKNIKVREVPEARKDTLLGAILCQAICGAVTVTTAAKVWDGTYSHDTKNPEGFQSIPEVSAALSPFSNHGGQFLVLFGFLGSALNATLVVAVTAVWSFSEACGWKTDRVSFVQHSVSEKPVQYGLFALVITIPTILSLGGTDLVFLNVAVNILNTVLLPVALLMLVKLASDPEVLPEELLLQGTERKCIISVLCLLSVGSFAAIIAGGFE